MSKHSKYRKIKACSVQRGAPRALLLTQSYLGLARACPPSGPAPFLASPISLRFRGGSRVDFFLLGLGRRWVWKHMRSKKRRTWTMDTLWPKTTQISLSIAVSSRLGLKASLAKEPWEAHAAVGLLRAQAGRPGPWPQRPSPGSPAAPAEQQRQRQDSISSKLASHCPPCSIRVLSPQHPRGREGDLLLSVVHREAGLRGGQSQGPPPQNEHIYQTTVTGFLSESG